MTSPDPAFGEYSVGEPRGTGLWWRERETGAEAVLIGIVTEPGLLGELVGQQDTIAALRAEVAGESATSWALPVEPAGGTTVEVIGGRYAGWQLTRAFLEQVWDSTGAASAWRVSATRGEGGHASELMVKRTWIEVLTLAGPRGVRLPGDRRTDEQLTDAGAPPVDATAAEVRAKIAELRDMTISDDLPPALRAVFETVRGGAASFFEGLADVAGVPR